MSSRCDNSLPYMPKDKFRRRLDDGRLWMAVINDLIQSMTYTERTPEMFIDWNDPQLQDKAKQVCYFNNFCCGEGILMVYFCFRV